MNVHLEELASRGNMSKVERVQYDYEWKIYNDYLNTFNSSEKKGHAERLVEGWPKGALPKKMK